MQTNINSYHNYFFIGIAGTGMSAIAQYLNGNGKQVSGSDRLFGKGRDIPLRDQFEKMGILCYGQDGTGIHDKIDVVVVSSAIEESNIEYQKAQQLNIPIIKRPELLASLSTMKKAIAVAGTSGKSTTAAMIFHIMHETGYDPSLMTGAGLTSLQKKEVPGNAWVGKGQWLVIEADESDGSIVNYRPETGLLLNIDRDHKDFDTLMQLFTTFKNNTKGTFIVNHSHPLAQKLSQHPEHDFGINANVGFPGDMFVQDRDNIQFELHGIPFKVPGIGRHNMENALAAVAACATAGLSIDACAQALKNYEGIYRRTQVVGEKNGVMVIDDFAHNPAEVKAAIQACQVIGKRVFAWFQPHGFGPLRFMHKELAQTVAEVLQKDDRFFISDVYYAGGTVTKDIQSDVVQKAIAAKGQKAFYIPDRKDLMIHIIPEVQAGDVILLMGARDPSLDKFAAWVLERIEK